MIYSIILKTALILSIGAVFLFIPKQSSEPKTAKKTKMEFLKRDCYLLSKRYRMQVTVPFIKDSNFILLKNNELSRTNVLDIVKSLNINCDKKVYAMNLAINKSLKDTTLIVREENIIAVTIYHPFLFGLYNKEVLYVKKKNGWQFVKSNRVKFYFSCSQRYWLMKDLDSNDYKSEILIVS